MFYGHFSKKGRKGPSAKVEGYVGTSLITFPGHFFRKGLKEGRALSVPIKGCSAPQDLEIKSLIRR